MSDEDTQEPTNLEAIEPSQEVETPEDEEAREPEGQPDDVESEDGTQDDTQSEEADAEDQSDEDDGSDEEAETQADGETDLVDVEYEGKIYKLPPELKNPFMRDKDYRHKTQAIAEERKSVSEMRQAVEQVAQLTHKELTASVELQSTGQQLQEVSQRLDQYGQVDWNAWEVQDFDGFKRGENEYRQLQAQERALRGKTEQLSRTVQETAQGRTKAQREELDKRVEATQNHAKKNIPGWTTELDQKIGEFAKTKMQVDDAWMAQNLTPQVYDMAYLAYIGAQSLERAKAKPKAAKSAKPKPLTKVKSKTGSTGRKKPSEMNMEEYADYMNKQEADSRRA